ncbi:MAG TPA: hypothetical protein VFP53_08470 [Sphingomicrobium sp.]|nr:hypothetical protein [Sphingomicrobium sp.]
MSTERKEEIADAIREHGNQLGSNLVYLKTFLEGQRKLQAEFLADQSRKNEKIQSRATRAAVWSAVAAIAAAVAAILQALASMGVFRAVV